MKHYRKLTYEDIFEHDLNTQYADGHWLFPDSGQYTEPPFLLSGSYSWLNMLNSKEFYLYLCREARYPRLRNVEWKQINSDNENVWEFFRSCLQSLNNLWLANNANAIDMLYKTLIAEQYNPLHNYDKDSIITDVWGITRTQNDIGERNTTDTNGARKSNTLYDEFITSHKSERYHDDKSSSPYDTENVFLSERLEHVPENDETTTQNEHGITVNDDEFEINSVTNSAQDVLVVEEHTDTHTEKTKGNIGVTTSAQMATGEIELRTSNQFLRTVLKLYLEQCTTFHESLTCQKRRDLYSTRL